MRLSITDDGFWRIDLIRRGELEMISDLIATASPSDEATLRRLAPDPIRPELTGQQELLDDWDELVRPEIYALLDSALQTVQLDLAQIHAVPPDEIPADAEDDEDFDDEGDFEDDDDFDDDDDFEDDEDDLPEIFGLDEATAEHDPDFDDLSDDGDPSSDTDAHGDDALFRLNVPLAHVEDWAKTLNRARLAFAASYDLLDEDTLSPATIIMLVERGGNQAIDDYLRTELYGFLLAFLVDEAMSQ